MMSMQGRRPWDLESVSSQTSDATSRATTIPDSPSQTSIPTQQRSNAPSIDGNRSTTTSASVNTVISRNSGAQGIKRNQQQQQPWVNPYWGSNATTGGNATSRG